jgi:hypothetical protein
MRPPTHWTCLLLLGSWAGPGYAEIVDRIAVVVNTQAIKQSDISIEIELTDFLNREKLDFSLPEQKKAASRLIDQTVIRKEIETEHYVPPNTDEADKLLTQIKQRYRNEEAYRQALSSYQLTEAMLVLRLRWQVTVLQFVSTRFGDQTEAAGEQSGTNQAFFSWLDETRKQTRIVYKVESLK